MDYLASHPWVAVAGLAAIGAGVWWWMSRKEKFGLGRRIKAIIRRKQPEGPYISYPEKVERHASPMLLAHGRYTPDYERQFAIPKGWGWGGYDFRN